MNHSNYSVEYILTLEPEGPLAVGQTYLEVDVTVTGTVTPVVPARLYGEPGDCYPAEGGDVEDIEATIDGQVVELSKDQLERAEEGLREASIEEVACRAEARAEAQNEAAAEARAERGY